ncbi:MAG: hypothetical protein K2X50_01150 [Gammaproteobacteria bacterium]|nr:hypothetical protein [Gammaproteobacteria bacterium]
MIRKRYVVYHIEWLRLGFYERYKEEFDDKENAMNYIENNNPMGQFVLVDFGESSNETGKAIYITP